MKKLLNLFLCIIVCSVLISSCGSKKTASTGYITPENVNASQILSPIELQKKGYSTYKQGDLNFLLKDLQSDTSNNQYSLKVNLQLKSFYHLQPYLIDSNEIKSFILNNESELITFNNLVGVKFYRTVINEFGVTRNFIKYHVFTYNNGYWVRVNESALQEYTISDSPKNNLNINTSFSSSDKTYYKLNYGFEKI